MRRLTEIVLILCLTGVFTGYADDGGLTVDCMTVEPENALSARELDRLTIITPPATVSSTEIDRTAENIRATGRFTDVSWHLQPAPCGAQLVFHLEPQPYVAGLSFQGNHQVSDRRLERSSDLRKFQPYSPELLSRSLVQLRDYYILKGFPAPRFQADVEGPGDDGAMDVTVTVREINLPKAERFEYEISGHPGPWWRFRLQAVLRWARWKATRRGLNMEQLRSVLRHEEKALKETGYRNAEINLGQTPGEMACHPCLAVNADVARPVRIHF
nr:POTRA domain-containing protein [bacterium]